MGRMRVDRKKVSLANNFLYGIRLRGWLRLLFENQWQVEKRFWHRAVAVTGASVANSFFHRAESALLSKTPHPDTAGIRPLFILGHWRTGTTHLQYLLAQDTRRFAFANTFQVMNPSAFLMTERLLAPMLRNFVPKTRPMDAMALGMDSPAEDEFAMALMTGRSPYMGLSFPRNRAHYERYLTFKRAPASETQEWKEAFRKFVGKLTRVHPSRDLLLKSPAHTARIPLLLELFPEARFVHIVRDPYSVFMSSRHIIATLFPYMFLQEPNLAEVDEDILQRYDILNGEYLQTREMIPPGRLFELRYEDLETKPLEVLESLYGTLGYSAWGDFKPVAEQYLAGLKGYRKNVFPPLDEQLKRQIARRWERYFKAFRYSI
jgi:omega-hydroxy-beta-dihydromenaquinone-9 sulfotransferase